jgi:hypothetical protein
MSGLNDSLKAAAAELRDKWAGRDWAEQPLEVMANGGGVQSLAMMKMIEAGDLPRPDMFIFSDTLAEMPATIANIETRCIPLAESLGIPFITVCAASTGGYAATIGEGEGIYEYSMATGTMPRIGNRSCTGNFKIAPQRRFARAIVGNKNGVVLVRFWLGISHDERGRARFADEPGSSPAWCELRFPLLEDEREITRDDCRATLEAAGWGDVEKSGCHFCPYQTLRGWVALKRDHPELWLKALALEARFREARPEQRRGLYRGWLRDALPEVTLKDYGFFEGELDAPPVNHLGRPVPACDEPGGGCFL